MVKLKCNFIHSFVTRNFSRLGGFIARHPKTCIAIPVVLTVFFSLGVLRLRIVDDFEYLYAPKDGRSWQELAVVQSYFDMNFSTSFDPRKIARFKPYGQIIILAKDGGSILKDNLFKEIIRFDRNISTFTIKVDGSNYSYQNICAQTTAHFQKKTKCFGNQVLHLKNRMQEIENGTLLLHYPLHVEERNFQLNFYGGVLGGVETDAFGFMRSAKALRLMYFLDPYYGEIVDEWEEAFLQEVDKFKSENIFISRVTSQTLGKEMTQTSLSMLPKLPLTAFTIILFSVLSCLMKDWVMGKPWIGVLSCIGAFLAIISGAGLCLALGLEFAVVTSGAAFVVLGVAMDDAFIILAAWRLTHSSWNVETRMKKAFAHSGISITLTSLTNIICFAMCITTPIEGLRNFSIFAVVMIAFSFVYQLLFTGGFLAIFGKFEKDNRHSLTCRRVVPLSMSQNRSTAYKLFCTGGKNPEDPDNPIDNREHLMMVFFRDYIGGFVTYTPAKIFLVIVFLVYLSVSIYGALQLSEGLEADELLVTNSHTYNYSTANSKYFNAYTLSIQVLITTPLDYSNATVQMQLENLVDNFKRSPFVSEYSDFWLTQYLFMKKSMGFLLWKYDLNSKTGFLECLKNVFLNMPLTKEYENDIIFNDDNTEIIASRFFILTACMKNSRDIKNMLLFLRQIADDSVFQVTVYNPNFIAYDQLIRIRSTAIKTISISVTAIMLVTIMFFPSLTSGIIVGLYMLTTEIGVVGLMVLWGVKLNTLSMMGLIISIGLAVDNTAHMTHAYLSSQYKDDSKAKVKDALYFVGMAIMQATLSTYIGCFGMVTIPSKFYVSLFKLLTLVLWLSSFNCLLILPIFLSLFDDAKRWGKNGNKDKSDEADVSIKIMNGKCSETVEPKDIFHRITSI